MKDNNKEMFSVTHGSAVGALEDEGMAWIDNWWACEV